MLRPATWPLSALSVTCLVMHSRHMSTSAVGWSRDACFCRLRQQFKQRTVGQRWFNRFVDSQKLMFVPEYVCCSFVVTVKNVTLHTALILRVSCWFAKSAG